MHVDSEQPEDRIHETPYPSCRTRQRDVESNKDAESKTENQENDKYKKLAPKPITKHLRNLEEANDGKHCYKQDDSRHA